MYPFPWCLHDQRGRDDSCQHVFGFQANPFKAALFILHAWLSLHDTVYRKYD